MMDYFGTAVNLAARVEKESRGGDIIVTDEIWCDPHVQEVLAGRKHEAAKESCMLRGLAGSRDIYRVQPKS